MYIILILLLEVEKLQKIVPNIVHVIIKVFNYLS